MKKNYLITNLNNSQYKYIITLTNYNIQISDYLKKIKINGLPKSKVIIDTALVSGLSSYRFIETTILPNSSLDHINTKYVKLNNYDLHQANIIAGNSNYLKYSALSNRQKEIFLNYKNKESL